MVAPVGSGGSTAPTTVASGHVGCAAALPACQSHSTAITSRPPRTSRIRVARRHTTGFARTLNGSNFEPCLPLSSSAVGHLFTSAARLMASCYGVNNQFRVEFGGVSRGSVPAVVEVFDTAIGSPAGEQGVRGITHRNRAYGLWPSLEQETVVLPEQVVHPRPRRNASDHPRSLAADPPAVYRLPSNRRVGTVSLWLIEVVVSVFIGTGICPG